MPGGDGTGPGGMGAMTGRAAGYCAGYAAPGFASPVVGVGRGLGFGRGRGVGRGMGMGFRGGRGAVGNWGMPPAQGVAYGLPPVPAVPYGYGVAPNAEQQANALKGQAEYFEEALTAIKKQIADLDVGAKD